MGDEKDQQNSERSDGPDEIGSDPNMTGRGAAVVPCQDQSLKLEFFTVLYVFHEIYHLFVLLPQDFGGELNLAVAVSICVCVHILCGIWPRRNLTASHQRPDEIGSCPNMTGRGAAVVPWQDQSLKLEFFTFLYVFHEIYHFFVLLPQDFGWILNIAVAINICVCVHILCGIRPRRNLTASYQRPDEIGSYPNMTGRGDAVVPWQDQSFELEFFTVFYVFHEIYHFFVLLPQDFGWKLNIVAAISICVCVHILCGIRPRHNLTASHIHHIKPFFPLNTKPYFPSHIHRRFHIYAIRPCDTSLEASCGECERTKKKKDEDDEIMGMPNDFLLLENRSSGCEHSQHPEEKTISPAYKTKSSDAELSQQEIDFLVQWLDAEGQCSPSTHNDCWILDEDVGSSNDLSFVNPLATESPCSDPALEEAMAAAFPPPVPPVPIMASSSLLAPTEAILLVEEGRAQSLQCSTESTAQNNLAQTHFPEEGRSVEMDEKLECIQIPQPASFSRHLTLADLQPHFGKKRSDVAKSLGVSVSTLKRVKRRCGIDRWPYTNKKNKRVTKSVQVALGAFNPSTSSQTDAVGSNYQHSQGSKAPKPQEKKLLTSCKKPSIGGQVEIADQMLESRLSAHEGQLQEQNRFHLHKQDAGSVTIKATIKATYGEDTVKIFELKKEWARRMELEHVGSVTIRATYGQHTVKVPFSVTSGIFELKKELATRLELEHGSFNVKYEDDEDGGLILIACDSALYEWLTSLRDIKVIKLLVLDKGANSNHSSRAAGH